MSGLKRQQITVVISDGQGGERDPIEIVLLNPDYIRIERELPKLGLPVKPKASPMSYMTAAAWAACKRLGHYDGQLRDFLNVDCLLVDFPRDAEGKALDDEVDPTQRAVATD